MQAIDSEQTRLLAADPRQYPGWDKALAAHPASSFFHSSAWSQVLIESYGHRPFYICRQSSGETAELLPVMEVDSPWTGRRGVSLPFTDFCVPLTGRGGRPGELHERVLALGRERGWRYLECRHNSSLWPGSLPSVVFRAHVLELAGGAEKVLRAMDGATRRGIRRAQAAGLRVAFGVDRRTAQEFYRLHCRTRRRHGVPPQPSRFFENIARHVFESGHGFIAMAYLGQRLVAAAVFSQHVREAIFKFGASDYAYRHLRPNNLVMWAGIQRLAEEGFARVHLGRTSLGNEGLRRFKLGFGAQEEKLEYCRYDFRRNTFVTSLDRAESWANPVFRRLPLPLLRLAGRLLYPHLS